MLQQATLESALLHTAAWLFQAVACYSRCSDTRHTVPKNESIVDPSGGSAPDPDMCTTPGAILSHLCGRHTDGYIMPKGVAM